MFSDVDIKILQHGYDREYRVILPDEGLFSAAKEFLKGKINLNIPKIYDLDLAKSQAEYFMKKNFKLHKIYFSDEKAYSDFFHKNKHLEKNTFIEEYNKFGSFIEPFSLPISLIDEDFWFGYLLELGINQPIEEFFTNTKTIFSRMLISRIMTCFTPSIIIHEITHGQLNSIKGAMKSYYNYEVLPIFINMLYHLENDSLKSNFEVEKVVRYKEISTEIIGLLKNQQEKYLNESLQFIYTMHIESVLKALQLLDVYINSNKSTQCDIKDFIQNIFDGKNYLEELLDNYNINLEDGSELFIKDVLKK